MENGEELSELLRKINQQRTIAKVIYKNELRAGNFSSTAGLQHIESRYNRENFWLVDQAYASTVTREGGLHPSVDPYYVNSIDDKVLYVKFNPNFCTYQLPQKKKICEEFSFAEKRASAYEIVRMQVQEGACLSILGTLS